MPTPVRKKTKDGGDKSDIWWLRKKVPQRFRAMVDRKEIWRSLDTTDKRAATALCVQRSAELEAEWKHRAAALRDAEARAVAYRPVVPEAMLSALQREVHERTRDAHLVDPGWHLRWAALSGVPDAEREAEEREFIEQAMDEFLAKTGEEFNQADRDRFLPLFAEARRRGYHDLLRAAKDSDFSPSPLLERYAPKPPRKLDFAEAFEFYCANGEIKGGTTGPTAKRWRPKIAAFCKFVGHDDLARVTTEDGYRWADELKARGVAPRASETSGSRRSRPPPASWWSAASSPRTPSRHALRPRDAGDALRPALGSVDLRLFGSSHQRDHLAPATRRATGS